MTTRSQKKKAVEALFSVDQKTPLSGNNQSENPVAGTSKSPNVRTENLEEIKSTLRKAIISDLTKISKTRKPVGNAQVDSSCCQKKLI